MSEEHASCRVELGASVFTLLTPPPHPLVLAIRTIVFGITSLRSLSQFHLLAHPRAPSRRLGESRTLVNQEVGVDWGFEAGRYLIPLTDWPPGQAENKTNPEV